MPSSSLSLLSLDASNEKEEDCANPVVRMCPICYEEEDTAAPVTEAPVTSVPAPVVTDEVTAFPPTESPVAEVPVTSDNNEEEPDNASSTTTDNNENDAKKQWIVLPNCHHTFCSTCLSQWLLSHHSTCPECRMELSPDEIQSLVGTMIPTTTTEAAAASIEPAAAADEIDDLTLTWLQEQGAMACPGCGIYIVKQEGCSNMMCRCGQRFDFETGQAHSVNCDGEDVYYEFGTYYDNVRGCEEDEYDSDECDCDGDCDGSCDCECEDCEEASTVVEEEEVGFQMIPLFGSTDDSPEPVVLGSTTPMVELECIEHWGFSDFGLVNLFDEEPPTPPEEEGPRLATTPSSAITMVDDVLWITNGQQINSDDDDNDDDDDSDAPHIFHDNDDDDDSISLPNDQHPPNHQDDDSVVGPAAMPSLVSRFSLWDGSEMGDTDEENDSGTGSMPLHVEVRTSSGGDDDEDDNDPHNNDHDDMPPLISNDEESSSECSMLSPPVPGHRQFYLDDSDSNSSSSEDDEDDDDLPLINRRGNLDDSDSNSSSSDDDDDDDDPPPVCNRRGNLDDSDSNSSSSDDDEADGNDTTAGLVASHGGRIRPHSSFDPLFLAPAHYLDLPECTMFGDQSFRRAFRYRNSSYIRASIHRQHHHTINPRVWRASQYANPDCIWTAVKVGNLAMVQQELALDPSLLDAKNDRRSLMYYASLCGHDHVCEYLIARGAKGDYECFMVALNNECRAMLKPFKNNK